jgi:hypothetical protein
MELEKSMAGFVTRQINIQGQTLEEIEKRLGYHQGRLSQGAYFYVSEDKPAQTGFEFAGYSQVAGHNTQKQYGNINQASQALEISKRNVLEQIAQSKSTRLVKVIPVIRHNEKIEDDNIQYPPGSGIQQWKLTQPLKFKLECFIANYPHGRFIPMEGFQSI